MARKKKKKRHDFDTVSPQHGSDTAQVKPLQIETKAYDIQFVPIVINPETGYFENIDLFEQLLPVLEETSAVFGDDSMPPVESYREWLAYHIAFVQETAPWAAVVVVDGKAQGIIWASNWGTNGTSCHSVDIAGLCKRKTPTVVTTLAIHKFLSYIFQQTEVYVVRAECEEGNKAAIWAMARAGLSHSEKRRAYKIREGREIAGIIRSITRPEWMEVPIGQEKE